MNKKNITVKITTNASRDEIKKINDTTYKIRITKTPVKGQANKQIVYLYQFS